MRAPTPFVFPLLMVLAAGTISAEPVSLDGLVTESPFVLKHAETSAAPAATENATVEFRGMIATKDGVLFGFFDRTKNTSAWVKEHDKDSEFNVRSYDVANDTVALDYQGQKFALALSTAKISTAAPIVNPVAHNGGQNGGEGGNRKRGNGGGNGNGDAATKRPIDPQALESVAEKVRSLRAQRQAAAANGGAGGGANGAGGASASTQAADGSTSAAAPARQGRGNRNR